MGTFSHILGFTQNKFISPYLTAAYGEKVKAYLRRGARPVRGEEVYPNPRVGDYDIIVSSQQGASKIKVFRWFSPNIFSLQKQ